MNIPRDALCHESASENARCDRDRLSSEEGVALDRLVHLGGELPRGVIPSSSGCAVAGRPPA
jgi:hypothetical protein